jgi:hypothetical protein
MGTNPKVCFFGGMGRRNLIVSQGRKVGIFLIFQGLFFWWCEMGWLEKGVGYIYIYCPFFFFDMVT